MASSSSSCSFPYVVLGCLNFTLFILSLVSLAPTVIINPSPTSIGWALIAVSSISLLSSFLGFYSQSCFVTHLTLVIASLAAQLVAILALFTKEKSTLSMLKSPRDPREVMVLGRLECGLLMAMFMLQTCVLCFTGCVNRCWLREYRTVAEESIADVEMKHKESEKLDHNSS